MISPVVRIMPDYWRLLLTFFFNYNTVKMNTPQTQQVIDLITSKFNYMVTLTKQAQELMKDHEKNNQEIENIGVYTECLLSSLVALFKYNICPQLIGLRPDNWTKAIMELDDFYDLLENDPLLSKRLNVQAEQVFGYLWELKHLYAGVKYDDRYYSVPDWLDLDNYREQRDKVSSQSIG